MINKRRDRLKNTGAVGLSRRRLYKIINRIMIFQNRKTQGNEKLKFDRLIFGFASEGEIDELSCASRRSSAFEQSPTFGKSEQIILRGLEFAIGGKLANDGKIF